MGVTDGRRTAAARAIARAIVRASHEAGEDLRAVDVLEVGEGADGSPIFHVIVGDGVLFPRCSYVFMVEGGVDG